MISMIIAPESAAQTLPAPEQRPHQPQPPRLDRLDEKILETLRDSGICQIWSVLNTVADGEDPRNRSEGRVIRLRLLDKLRRLNRLGLVFFAGRNMISPVKPDDETVRAIAGWRRRTVRKAPGFRAVSARVPTAVSNAAKSQQLILREADNAKRLASEPTRKPDETKSGPTVDEISTAATILAKLPRKKTKRRWTGFIDFRRCYRDQPVNLPDGQSGYIYGVLRHTGSPVTGGVSG